MMMNLQTDLIEIPGLLSDKIHKVLKFSADGLTIEKILSFTPADHITAEDITGFRYGMTWTRGYKFVIGRQYYVEIQDQQKNVTRIKLSSYYSIRKKFYGKIWLDIIQQLWKHYFLNQCSYYFELYKMNQEFELCGVRFHFSSLSWDDQNVVQLDDVAISSYRTYFVIYNINNKKQMKSRSFANDWNAVILQYLLKRILKDRKVPQ